MCVCVCVGNVFLWSISPGSTDVIVYSAQGINDPVTSALHIIIGMCAAHACEEVRGKRWPIFQDTYVYFI